MLSKKKFKHRKNYQFKVRRNSLEMQIILKMENVILLHHCQCHQTRSKICTETSSYFFFIVLHGETNLDGWSTARQNAPSRKLAQGKPWLWYPTHSRIIWTINNNPSRNLKQKPKMDNIPRVLVLLHSWKQWLTSALWNKRRARLQKVSTEKGVKVFRKQLVGDATKKVQQELYIPAAPIAAATYFSDYLVFETFYAFYILK